MPVQLRLDALLDLENADARLNSRAKGDSPSERALLTERRDAMRALYAELSAPRRGNPARTGEARRKGS